MSHLVTLSVIRSGRKYHIACDQVTFPLLNNGPQRKSVDPGESDVQRSCKRLPLIGKVKVLDLRGKMNSGIAKISGKNRLSVQGSGEGRRSAC